MGSDARLLINGDHHGFAAWFAGAVFIPTLALALGVWTGGSKAFEAIYIIWWYMGPAHHIPGIDFMGTTPASSTPIPYLVATAFLLGAAYWGRRTRIAMPETFLCVLRGEQLRAILIRFLGAQARNPAVPAEIQIVQIRKDSPWPLPQSILPAVTSSVF